MGCGFDCDDCHGRCCGELGGRFPAWKSAAMPSGIAIEENGNVGVGNGSVGEESASADGGNGNVGVVIASAGGAIVCADGENVNVGVVIASVDVGIGSVA